MAKTFYLEIIATDRVFFKGDVEHLVITAIDGLLGILPGHEPLVTSLPTGELKYMVDGVWRGFVRAPRGDRHQARRGGKRTRRGTASAEAEHSRILRDAGCPQPRYEPLEDISEAF